VETPRPTKPPSSAREVARAASPAAAARPKPQSPPAAPTRAARPAAPRPAPPASLFDRTKAVRDLIAESKLTAADPWAYTEKARAWTQRAQSLLDEVARSQDGGDQERRLAALRAEIEGDADFQEARRRA
jgi:hypothetical protein